MTETSDVRRQDVAVDRPRTVRTTFDWSETEPAVAVVETVAVATDRTPLDVYSLHDVLETDALNELVESGADSPDAVVRASFRFDGCHVTVRGDGLVRVEIVEES